MNESTSYLKIEVLGETIENGERVIRRRKICIGNPVEDFVTEEVVRVPIPKKVEKVKVSSQVKTKKTVVKKTPNPLELVIEKANKGVKKVRARNNKGHFIADDPSTPENEAWVEEKEVIKSKPKRKRGRPKK